MLFGGTVEFSHPIWVLMQHAKMMRFVHAKHYFFTSELQGYRDEGRKSKCVILDNCGFILHFIHD